VNAGVMIDDALYLLILEFVQFLVRKSPNLVWNAEFSLSFAKRS